MSRLSGDGRHREPLDSLRAAALLASRVLSSDDFDEDAVLAELLSLRIEANDILDICIPEAARALGQGWLDDELSFTRVSAASSRLFRLSKALSSEWDNLVPSNDSHSILVATFRRDDHLLGPGILVQQLRRRHHSVHLMSNTDAASVGRKVATGEFDCLMVSVASIVSLEAAIADLKSLQLQGALRIPVIVGGKALEYTTLTSDDVAADLVTDDLDLALAALPDLIVARKGGVLR